MTSSTLLTGKPGEGKGLSAVHLMRKYLNEGRMVATNMDIKPWLMTAPFNQTRCYRVPDIPTKESLESLPLGNPSLEWLPGESKPSIKPGSSYSENDHGLLVLDECSVFLNSRKWQGHDREGLLHWLAHHRKYGWDLLLIAQGIDQVDKQVRTSICDLFATTKDLSKVEIPFLSAISKTLFGMPLKFPPIRVYSCRYGYHQGAQLSESRTYRGDGLYQLYDTLQIVDMASGQQAVSTFLSAWEMKGRFMTPYQLHGRIGIVGMLAGFALGVAAVLAFEHLYPAAPAVAVEKKIEPEKDVFISGVITSAEGFKQLVLTSGAVVRSTGFEASAEGIVYQAAGKSYRMLP
jgi:hypothetical protein